MWTIDLKKLAAVALATAINAGLLLVAGPLSRFLRLPEQVLPLYVLGLIVFWYVMFAIMLLLASPSDAPFRRRLARVLGESAISILIFCGVVVSHVARLG